MGVFSPIILFITLFVVILHSAKSYLYEIKPHLHSSCIQQTDCLTLSQFDAQLPVNDSNITLSFLPGNHTLSTSLAISDVEYLEIIAQNSTENDNNTHVLCNSLGNIRVNRTTTVYIAGVKFIGCGNNVIDSVSQFTLERSTFQGTSDSVTALVLTSVVNAVITRSYFCTNTVGSTFMDLQYPAFQVGGALRVSGGTLEITNSTFEGNRAERGGAIFAENNATVHMIGITANSNRAQQDGGGIIHLSQGCTATITASVFSENVGSVVAVCGATLFIEDSIFTNNVGGVYAVNRRKLCSFYPSNSLRENLASISISQSQFFSNIAREGAVVNAMEAVITIEKSNFTLNMGTRIGGVLLIQDSFVNISDSILNENTARFSGGVLSTQDSSVKISDSVFYENTARFSGGVIKSDGTSFGSGYYETVITNCSFVGNMAMSRGGCVESNGVTYRIDLCTFQDNSAFAGAAAYIDAGEGVQTKSVIVNSSFSFNKGTVLNLARGNNYSIENCTFEFNSAEGPGTAVIYTTYTNLTVSESVFRSNYFLPNIYSWYANVELFGSNTFWNNTYSLAGGVLLVRGGVVTSNGMLTVSNNTARSCVVLIVDCVVTFTGSTLFENNNGSLYAYGSNVTFFDDAIFVDQQDSSMLDLLFSLGNGLRVGGAITSVFGTLKFYGRVTLSRNEAISGGALLLVSSEVVFSSNSTVYITDNLALENGGGISLYRTVMSIFGNCTLRGNSAIYEGGAIHAVSSMMSLASNIASPTHYLALVNNSASKGGGAYFEGNAHLNVRKSTDTEVAISLFVNVTGNMADLGGGFYVADETTTGVCNSSSRHTPTLGSECFIQEVDVFEEQAGISPHTQVLYMSNNWAESGSNIYGGLLDRCTLDATASLSISNILFGHIATNMDSLVLMDITDLDTMASDAVRVCFCEQNRPACNSSHFPVSVKKGELFRVPVVVVDHVNHTLAATIVSQASATSGNLGENQRFQRVDNNCTMLEFNVFSYAAHEQLVMYAEGPCGDSVLSQTTVEITFEPCECPIGFEPIPALLQTRCECDCNANISGRIGNCNISTGFVMKTNVSWIAYTNKTDPAGFIVYPYCPYDYCISISEGVYLNFEQGDEGTDTQCALNRAGTLCGACKENFSLSLGSSLCLPCPSYWPAFTFLILLVYLIAGLILVILIFALNLTVATGGINGLLFYANIVEANKTIFFSRVSFQSVFISWFDLEFGFDVCFIEGLTAHGKAWVEFFLPSYLIIIVIAIIILSESFPKFSRLIGKRNPIAVLATLILLSYSRYLQNALGALSFATLHLPDGSKRLLWLPDATLGYFDKIRIPLFITAVVIMIVGLSYTLLLFSWQWIVRRLKLKIIRNHKFRSFIEAYTAPYEDKHRYWTGLLLLARLVLYLIVAVSETGDPQIPLVSTTIIMAGILVLKASLGGRVYKRWMVDITETVLYFNLLFLSVLTSFYVSKSEDVAVEVVSAVSVVITFLVFLVVVFCHTMKYVICPIIKNKLQYWMSRDGQDPTRGRNASKSGSNPQPPPAFDLNDRFRDLVYIFDSPSTEDYSQENSSSSLQGQPVQPTCSTLDFPQDA